MYIRENIEVGRPNNPQKARVCYFESLSEFILKAVKALDLEEKANPGRSHSVNTYRTGVKGTCQEVVTNGWPPVLKELVEVEEEAKRAYAPKRINPYSYQGNRVSIDRFLVGKPCISRPVKVLQKQPQFVRLFFIGEAMAAAGEQNFVRKCAKLLAYIRRAEAKGQRVELYLGFGGYSGVFPGSHACMAIARVKGFGEHIHIPTLSAVGHPSLLRSLQFGWEFSQGQVKTPDFTPPKQTGVGHAGLWNPETYRKALHCFITPAEADSTTFICSPNDIDPLGQLAQGN